MYLLIAVPTNLTTYLEVYTFPERSSALIKSPVPFYHFLSDSLIFIEFSILAMQSMAFYYVVNNLG
jgi:hypothetical protein